MSAGKWVTRETRYSWLARMAKWQGHECLRGPFTSDGYHRIGGGGQRSDSAHRYMCMVAHGEPPSPDCLALHSCGNKWCVNPQHLRWGTKAENMVDAIRDGDFRLGEDNPQSKLTAEDVHGIRAARRTGATYRQIEAAFPVTRGAIHRLLHGKTWKHIPDAAGNSGEMMAENVTPIPSAKLPAQVSAREIWAAPQPTDRQTWAACQYIHQADDFRCRGCPQWRDDARYGKVQSMCRGIAEECARAVMAAVLPTPPALGAEE